MIKGTLTPNPSHCIVQVYYSPGHRYNPATRRTTIQILGYGLVFFRHPGGKGSYSTTLGRRMSLCPVRSSPTYIAVRCCEAWVSPYHSTLRGSPTAHCPPAPLGLQVFTPPPEGTGYSGVAVPQWLCFTVPHPQGINHGLKPGTIGFAPHPVLSALLRSTPPV